MKTPAAISTSTSTHTRIATTRDTRLPDLGGAIGRGATRCPAIDTTGVFAGMAVLSASVLLVGLGVNRLERWLLRWKS